MEKVYRIHAKDNVVVALSPLKKGDTIEIAGKSVTLNEDIPAGHKIAKEDILKGKDIIKYGFPIGTAKEDIKLGSWVHSHNTKSKLGDLLEYSYHPENAGEPPKASDKKYTFKGYAREDGRAGIRNEVWIIPTVGCVNSIARVIEEKAQAFLKDYPNVEGVYAYSHPHGCSQLAGDHERTQKFLAGLTHSPNAGAVLLLSLGCENNQPDQMKAAVGDITPGKMDYLICQEVEDEITAGLEKVKTLMAFANKYKREELPASKLVFGLKCGGSDGFSGITANPLVGAVADKLIAAGGTAILTEVPEMFGAETLLMDRCKDEATFKKTVDLINNFKNYFKSYGEKVDENPSPGNKAGGITTLEDKSLGCVQKGGSATVMDVLTYGDRAYEKGLLLLQGPGNDLVAANALAAAGADMVLFTTGRGTPFACPVPTVKISSNSRIAGFKSNWIDFNAGALVEGATMEEKAEEFFEFLLKIASGEKHAKSEALDKHELAIFKDGVTL